MNLKMLTEVLVVWLDTKMIIKLPLLGEVLAYLGNGLIASIHLL